MHEADTVDNEEMPNLNGNQRKFNQEKRHVKMVRGYISHALAQDPFVAGLSRSVMTFVMAEAHGHE